MKECLLTLALSAFALCSKAENINIDSLRQIVATGTDETKADAAEKLGNYYHLQNNNDSAKIFYLQAGALYNKLNNISKQADNWINISTAYRMNIQHDTALEYLQMAYDYFEKAKNEEKLAKIMSNMAAIYNDLGNFAKYEEYALKALSIQERMGTTAELGISYVNLCIVMYGELRYNESIKYGKQAVKVFKGLEMPYHTAFALTALANSAINVNDKKSIDYLNEALSICDEINNDYLRKNILQIRARWYLQEKQYNHSYADVKTAIALADTANTVDMSILYYIMAKSAAYINADTAAVFFDRYIDAKERIQNEEWVNKLSEMEVKYETEKKETQIAAMKAERHLVIWLGISAGAASLLLSLVLVLRQIGLNQKKKAAEQRALRLEQEKQLVSTQAVLDGENKERSRLARDLHDGLGAMLSVVKLNLKDMSKHFGIIEGREIQQFSDALSMLDNSISELRRVAHHIMPDSLVRHGLRVSLEDFCRALPGAHFEYFGEDRRLDMRLEVTLYRCAYELVNNAIKHAHAKNINIQLQIDKQLVSLTVADDGIGFDSVTVSNGSGLDNIRQRVVACGGNFDIHSATGKGTEAVILIENCE